MNIKFRSFDEATKAMPMQVWGNFDPLSHNTIDDLAWIAQHEVDLFEEGEETDIKNRKQLDEVKRFVKRCRASI